MPPLKHQKHELFALEYFKTGNAAASALKAGYSVKYIRSIASRLSTNINILGRIQELQKKAEDASVMTVLERKQRLSEIARARVSDFVECQGGKASVKVDLESVHSAAILEVTTEDILAGRSKRKLAVVTKLKLRDPVAAISELNRMDGALAPTKTEITGKDGKPIQMETKANLSNLTDEELNTLESILEKTANPSGGPGREGQAASP